MQICPSCGGQGVKGRQVCSTCGGTGATGSPVIRVPFDYAFPNAVLTANQAGLQDPMQFDQDADFEHIWWVSSQTGTYSVSIRDGSTGRVFSNNPVNGENFAGSAAFPFPLVEPYVWARAGTAIAVFNDRSGAGNTVQLVMRGYKLFPAAAPQQGSSGAIVGQ